MRSPAEVPGKRTECVRVQQESVTGPVSCASCYGLLSVRVYVCTTHQEGHEELAALVADLKATLARLRMETQHRWAGVRAQRQGTIGLGTRAWRHPRTRRAQATHFVWVDVNLDAG